MKHAVANSRRQLGELAVMQNRVTETEKGIIRRAEERLEEVQAEIEKIRPQAHSRTPEYLSLVRERAQLHQVIAMGRQRAQ